MWIVAPPDSGKTTFISSMIADDLKRVARGECSIFVMDSQNELIPDIAALEMFAPGRPLHDKLIYLEPTSRYPLALNIFDTKQNSAHAITVSCGHCVPSTVQKVVDPSFRASLLRLLLDFRRALDGRSWATRAQDLEAG
jgi:hypothetical protein